MIPARPNALLIDTTRCVGCGACALACKERNQLPKTAAEPTADTLSDKTFTVLERRGPRFVRRLCMHCVVPSCVSACPVGAFQKSAAGPVVYDQDKCMGCRYCMLACPFNVPKYEWGKALPRVRKCDMCADRQAQGLKTACATACPTGATTFGDREALLKEAEERIRKEPNRYHPGIYGDDEVGGTSVLYISDAPPDQLGLPTQVTAEPPAMLTWRVLKIIPDIVTLGAVALGGIWWIRNRKDDVDAAEGRGHAPHPPHGEDH